MNDIERCPSGQSSRITGREPDTDSEAVGCNKGNCRTHKHSVSARDSLSHARTMSADSGQFSGLLRRNSSMPSLVFAADDDEAPIMPRNKSADDCRDVEDDGVDHLIEVDGKVLLAPQPQRLSQKSNPYVGTFHHGHEASKRLGGGGEKSPPHGPLIVGGVQQRSPMLTSQGGSPAVRGMCEAMTSQTHRERMKQALQLNASVPSDPEMCGLQALLPRQSGIQVQYAVGEGSFGKCVKVLNRKNRQQWSKNTSRRGIERHLNEIPREGDSLVIKYIKRENPGAFGGQEESGDAQGRNSSGQQCSLQREIRIHGKCRHPNIVRLFGHYELGDKVGLILGFVEGAELHDLLHIKRTLPESECFIIGLQMMRAADYMHSISIIHRDLKPRNVLVSSGLRAHVIDLGLAIDISDPADRRVAAKKVVGTQGYMPPESLRGETATFAVDMWALGVMLYEMAFGFAPFLAHELLLPSKVEFPDASWGFKVSPELSSLLSVLLDKDAAKRGSATQALQHAWFEEGVVLAADRHLTEAEVAERMPASEDSQLELTHEIMKTVALPQLLRRLRRASLAVAANSTEDGMVIEEHDDVDPVHNGLFSYAYYHAIIVEGGRNDLD